ncbi:MFS transporter [Mesorhizobium sp.]|uniref:MFS transporter n=1 Tax=Mesorhizobium sp. TaxID=1871066 RepID=UPI002693B7FA
MQSFSAFVVNNVRWLAGAFLLTLVSSFGQTFFIALSNGDIRETFGLSHGEFGGLYMLATLLSAATLPFLGRSLDRYSTVTMAIATRLMLACATIAMGFAGSLPTLLLALYLLRLFGQGMMTQTALTATGRWFAANRGRAVSVVTLGFHVGGALLPCSSSWPASSAGGEAGSSAQPSSWAWPCLWFVRWSGRNAIRRPRPGRGRNAQ